MAEPGLPAGLPAVAEEEEGEGEEPRCPAQRADQSSLADEVAELRRRVKKQESRISELATYAGVIQKESISSIREKVEQLCARSGTEHSALESPEAERPAEEGEAQWRLPAEERLNALVEMQFERRLAEELALVRQQVQEASAPRAAMEGFAQRLAEEMKEAFEALRSDLQLQGAESQAGLSTLQAQMEGYRLRAVGCEASIADLRAELDTRRGIDEQAMQGCLSGVCHELRETQMSQMRALLDHGEKLDACGSQVQGQGSRLEELEAAVGELSRCLVDIGSRLRELKECVSGGGEDKADFAVLGLRLQALQHLLASQRSQRAGAEDAVAPPADQLQQATAPEASELPPGASAAAALAVDATVPSSPRQRAAGLAHLPASVKTLTATQTTLGSHDGGGAEWLQRKPSSAATPCAAKTAEVGQEFDSAAATDEADAARPRAAQQHPGAGGVVRSRSAPMGLQEASKPQPTPQQQALARQSKAMPWPQHLSAGSYAQGQLVARQAPAACYHQAPSRPHPIQRSGSPVPLGGKAAALGQPAPNLMRPHGCAPSSSSAAALLGTTPLALAPRPGASPPGQPARGPALLQWQRQQLPLRRIGA